MEKKVYTYPTTDVASVRAMFNICEVTPGGKAWGDKTPPEAPRRRIF